jgi:hypothetical protein
MSMHRVVAMLVLALAIGCGGPAPTTTPVAVCEPTQPNGATPPGEDPSPYDYGNGQLYTVLWPSGEILADPNYVEPDGSIGMKFPWWRAPGVGMAGDLRITGHEITTGESITASIPDGYGQRFQATGITFPTEGCYEVTGTSGDAPLTFVTKVTKVAAGPSSAHGTPMWPPG